MTRQNGKPADFKAARCRGDVSPVRDATVHFRPSPASGSCSERTVSAASARIGVSQITRNSFGDCQFSMTGPNHAANVLPNPVGACNNPLRPAAKASHASR